MKRAHVWVLLALLALAGGCILPKLLVPAYDAAEVQAVVTQPTPPPPPDDPALNQLRQRDGSLNILTHLTVDDVHDPSAALADDWRARYTALLPAVTPDDKPLTVFPIYDGSQRGVGLSIIETWEPLLQGLLAQSAAARQVGVRPAEQTVIPRVNELPVPWDEVRGEWLEAALHRVEAPDGARVLTGYYETVGEQNRLRLILADPMGGEDRVLFEELQPATLPAWELFEQQRRAARSAVQKMINDKLAAAAPKADHGTLELDDELSATMPLLHAPESWAVMEGIDRALMLARLFPGDALPLQAAACGYLVLGTMGFDYGHVTDEGFLNLNSDRLYGAREKALTQMALLDAPRAAVPQLMLMYHLSLWRNEKLDLLKQLMPAGAYLKDPPLLCFTMRINGQFFMQSAGPGPERGPMWMRSQEFAMQRRNAAVSVWQKRMERFSDDWPTNDQAMHAMMWMQADWAYREDDFFTSAREAAHNLYRLGIASEAAILLANDSTGSDTASLRKALSATFGANAGTARNTDALELRRELLKQFPHSTPVAHLQDFSAYEELLPALNEAARPLLDATEREAAQAVWPGLQMTTSERLLYARRRMEWAPVVLTSFNTSIWGNYEATEHVATLYHTQRPEAFSAERHFLAQMGGLLRSHPEVRDAYLLRLRDYAERWPMDLNTHMAYVRQVHQGDVEATSASLCQLARQYPETPWVEQRIGQFQCQQGNYEAGAAILKRASARMPERYDVAIEYAWARCQLGNWEDPELRDIFARPPRALTKNRKFHLENLKYLTHWLKDYPAAREAARFYAEVDSPSGGEGWMLEIEKLDNQTTRALELLERQTLPKQGLSRAGWLVNQAYDFWELGQPERATACIREAASIDSWKANVILALGDLALKTSDTQRARFEFERCIERYGRGYAATEGLSRCLLIEGKPDEAIALLEQEYRSNRDARGASLTMRLIKLYATHGKREQAMSLLGDYVVSPRRMRGYLIRAAKSLQDPQIERIIEDNVNDLMRRTLTREEAAEFWKRNGVEPPRPYLQPGDDGTNTEDELTDDAT